MIGVLGLGNEGFALYSYLVYRGFNVLGYTSNPENLRIDYIKSIGKIEGQWKFNVTDDLEKFLDKVDIIFVTSITTAYEEIAKKIVGIKNIDLSNKIFILFSSKFAGVLLWNKIFRDFGIESNIVETDAIFACRKTQSDTVWIRGIKGWNLLISNKDYFRGNSNWKIYGLIKDILGDVNLEVADNFVQRGLTDFGAMAHSVISLINLANIDNKRDMLFYIEGITDNTVILIEKVYEEFNQVAKFFNTSIIHPIELLDRYYGTVKNSLIDAIKNVPNYRYTKMPDSINNRFLYEDVLNTLYPMSLISRVVGIKLVLVPSIVNIVSIVLNIDLSKGRTLEKLGLIDELKLVNREVFHEKSTCCK